LKDIRTEESIVLNEKANVNKTLYTSVLKI